jgi:hypothetical protein
LLLRSPVLRAIVLCTAMFNLAANIVAARQGGSLIGPGRLL